MYIYTLNNYVTYYYMYKHSVLTHSVKQQSLTHTTFGIHILYQIEISK